MTSYATFFQRLTARPTRAIQPATNAVPDAQSRLPLAPGVNAPYLRLFIPLWHPPPKPLAPNRACLLHFRPDEVHTSGAIFVKGHDMKFPVFKNLTVLAWVVASITALSLGLIIVRAYQGAHDATNWVAHTLKVIRTLDEADGALARAEVAQLRYLLTGEKRLLVTRDNELAKVSRFIGEGNKQTEDNVAQQGRLRRLRDLSTERSALMNEAVRLR